MYWLKQSTSVTVKIGPFLDATDGVTAEGALTINQADVRLSKNGGNIAQKTDANAATHDELGYYDCNLDATDTGTLGRLGLMVSSAGALPVWHEYMVLPANVYDALVGGSDYLQVDTIQIEGSDATTILDTQIDSRLNTAIGASPTSGSIFERIKTLDDNYTATRGGYLDELGAANMPSDLDAVLADTNELQGDWVNGGRLDLIIDAILADTTSLNDTVLAEITGVSDIPATPTLRQAIMLVYMWLRNNTQSTADERRVLNDAGTEILDATMSDDGTTFSQGKLGAP